MALALYHFGPSPFSARVRVALEEKGLAWESRVVHLGVFEHVEPWFLRINPKGLLPALVDGETTVYESLDVLRYLEAQHPERPLLPADATARAEVEAWVARADALPLEELHGALASRRMLASERKNIPRVLARIDERAAENPDLAELYAEKRAAFEQRLWPYASPMPRAEALARMGSELDALERQLEGRAWVAGPTYTLADVVWTPALARLCLIGQERALRGPTRPNLRRYVDALRARRSYRTGGVWHRLSFVRIVPIVWHTLFGSPRRAMPW